MHCCFCSGRCHSSWSSCTCGMQPCQPTFAASCSSSRRQGAASWLQQVRYLQAEPAHTVCGPWSPCARAGVQAKLHYCVASGSCVSYHEGWCCCSCMTCMLPSALPTTINAGVFQAGAWREEDMTHLQGLLRAWCQCIFACAPAWPWTCSRVLGPMAAVAVVGQ